MNITLIGMPGAGKSTVGVVLSKIMGLDFCDTDIVIQQKFGKKLHSLIEEHGVNAFLDLEMQTILDTQFQDTVIATGGSVVYREKTMEYLQSISHVVYIDVSLEEIEKRVSNMQKRGVVSLNAKTLEEIFNERCALYQKYAHCTVKTDGCTLEESASKISDIFHI